VSAQAYCWLLLLSILVRDKIDEKDCVFCLCFGLSPVYGSIEKPIVSSHCINSTLITYILIAEHHISQWDKRRGFSGIKSAQCSMLDACVKWTVHGALALLERDKNSAADGAADTKLAAPSVDCLKRECSARWRRRAAWKSFKRGRYFRRPSWCFKKWCDCLVDLNRAQFGHFQLFYVNQLTVLALSHVTLGGSYGATCYFAWDPGRIFHELRTYTEEKSTLLRVLQRCWCYFSKSANCIHGRGHWIHCKGWL
jgi:hypothetical protein